MEKRVQTRKPLEQLTLLDRFLFAETMERPENLQILLEIILGQNILLKELPQTESLTCSVAAGIAIPLHRLAWKNRIWLWKTAAYGFS